MLALLLFTLAADPYAASRATLVGYLKDEGITDARVLKAVAETPRHEFVPLAQRRLAYHDQALPIGSRQTISPPYIVAYMTQTLDVQPHHKVLEIGTGSGYQAAILSPLVKDVYSIEIVEDLSRTATRTLRRLGLDNVHTRHGDGYLGWPEHAPFDRIIVTCSPEDIPTPLVEQLAEGGLMLIPLGERYQQVFHLLEKKDGELTETKLVPTLFVPMTGRSEDLRDVQPDPADPRVVNGGFEDVRDGDRPVGWHQVRQATIESGGSGGGRCVKLDNRTPGDLCQALQGMPLDGRDVPRLTVSAAFRASGIRYGSDASARPAVTVYLFDGRRDTIGRLTLGPFKSDTAQWRDVSKTFRVPRSAREAIIRIGMNGATGTLWLDDVEVRVGE